MSELRTRIVFSAEGTQRTVGDILKAQKALRELQEATQSLSQSMGISITQAQQISKSLSPEQIRQFSNAVNQAGVAAKQMGTQIGSGNQQAALSVAGLAAKYYLVVQSIQALLSAAKPVYDQLIGQNVQLNQQLLATQSSLAATNKVFQGGVEVTDPTQAIQALEGPVNDAIDKIRQGSLELVGVTSNQLIDSFRIVATEAGGVGINLDQAATLTLNFAAALGTLGVPLGQARQEIQSILQGTIDQNSVVSKSLGITNEQVRELKEQGRLYEFLNEKLAAFRAGNALAAQTIEGVSSNIQELIDEITRKAGEGLIEPIVEALNKVFEFLRDNKDELTEFLTNGVEGFLSLAKTIASAGEEVAKNLAPLFEKLGQIFDSDLGRVIEMIVDGLSKLVVVAAKMLAEDPALNALLDLTNGIIGAVAALQSLTPAYRESAEAVKIYGEQTKSAADQAANALARVQRGEENATHARTLAIGRIDDQIKALKDANLTGYENRDAIEAQIKALQEWRNKLQPTSGDIRLVSTSLEQQNAAMAALNETTQKVTNESTLAERRRLNEVQALVNQAVLTEREAAARRLKASQDRIQAELAAEEEKIRKLQALQPGTQRDNAIVAAENKAAQLRGQLLDAEVRQRQQALSEIAQATQEANQRATLAEQERLNQVTRLLNQGVITERQAAEQRLAITTARIQSEIQQEQQKLALLRQQPESDARDQAELASRQRLAQLTAQLLDAEANKQRQLREQVIAGIERQQQAEQVRHNAQVQNLERERAGIDALIRTQERLNQLADAQAALAASRSNLAQTYGQIEVDQLNRALEIRRKIDDPNTDSGVRQILEQQLRQLAGQASGEAQIIARKAEAEQRLAAQRRDALLQEQAQQRRALESEIERNRLAAQRLEIEARISALAAARAESDARATAAKVRQDPNASAEDRALADQAVGAATQNRQLADQAAKDAAAGLAQQNQLADASRQRLAADQEAARAQFNAAEQARVQAEQLAIAEARAKGLADQLGRGQQAQQSSGPVLRQDGMVDHDATHAAAVQRNMANALAASMPAIPTPAQLNPQLAPAATAQTTELTAIRNQLAPLEELVRSIAASSAATANRPAQPITVVQDFLDRSNPDTAAQIRREAGL